MYTEVAVAKRENVAISAHTHGVGISETARDLHDLCVSETSNKGSTNDDSWHNLRGK